MISSIGIGIVSGVAVTGIGRLAQLAHETLFGLQKGEYLSVAIFPEIWRPIVILSGGGLIVGLVAYVSRKFVHGRLSDTIEANALQGGRMSVIGSLYITVHTCLSNAVGASVGLEAAYTQFCGAVASLFGRLYDARRSEQRLLVACGAAAAIAAAFHAPFTGAFYGIEVVLGSYSASALAPIALSAIIATQIAATLQPAHGVYPVTAFAQLDFSVISQIVLMATLAGLAGIALMMMVAQSEKIFTRLPLPAFMKPVIGGLCVGAMTLYSPAILSAGHGTFSAMFVSNDALQFLALIIILKFVASAISLGSGFRGGLFFASLLIGELIGHVYGGVLSRIASVTHIEIANMAVLGMAAFGTAVIGAPLAMASLAVELTGNLALSPAALACCAIASIVVRELFGFSFATWRFHLRGETIRGPKDVGWVADIKVADMMWQDIKTLPHDMTIDAARRSVVQNNAREIFIVDAHGLYCGIVLVGDLYANTGQDQRKLATLARFQDHVLLPDMTIRQALDLFSTSHADVLAVVEHSGARKIIGALSESRALRRYGEELERRNFDEP